MYYFSIEKNHSTVLFCSRNNCRKVDWISACLCYSHSILFPSKSESSQSFIHSTHQIKKNQTKPNQTKPNQTKPNQNDLRGLNEGMIDLNLIRFQLSNLCEDELFYSIQSNPVQFNSIKSSSIQIQYITNLNQIQSV